MSSAGLQTLPDIAVEEDSGCVHYWIIDIPTGPVSRGECRLCGETREFKNFLEYVSGWDETRTLSHTSTGDRYSLGQLLGSAVESEREE